MSTIHVYDTQELLAQSAADQTVTALSDAINHRGSAVWVLAGGRIPLACYREIASRHKTTINWSRVTVIIGDERITAFDSPDNNWHAIDVIIGDLPTRKIRPSSPLPVEQAASEYNNQLLALPSADSGIPRLDVMWLGVGEDGHTLSLFPQHDSLSPSTSLVTAVRSSPKPPTERISLTLRALQGVVNAFILTGGSEKKKAVTDAQKSVKSPIALAVNIIETHNGIVTWLIDKDAAPTD